MRQRPIGVLSVKRTFEYGRQSAENLALGYERVVPVRCGLRIEAGDRPARSVDSQRHVHAQGGK